MSFSLLEEIALLPEDAQQDFLASIDDEVLLTLASCWESQARPEQLQPAWAWDYWLLIGGRGSGKTRPSAELVHHWATEPVYVALIGETAAEVRDVMIEGPSGLLATARPENPCVHYPSKRRVVWSNGAWGTTFSGDEPDQLRGPNADKAWVDELAKFKYPQETWDNLEMILRAGDHPQAVVSTTPRPIPLLRSLMADARTDAHPGGHNAMTRYSTYANIANLAPSFIARVVRKYEGTRLGRQELHAEMLDETPGALWTLALLEANRVTKAPMLSQIFVGVDPGGSSGVVVAGLGDNREGYVLEDVSPDEKAIGANPWAKAAVTAYHKYRANKIIVERNHGGAMVESTIKTIDPLVVVETVWASHGKYARAEPIASLDEQARIHHVGIFAAMEDELCNWVPGEGLPSPNRLDARVWVLTALMLGGGPAETGAVEDAPEDHYHSARGGRYGLAR